MFIFSQKRPRYEDDPNFVPNTVIGEGVTVMGGVIKGVNSVMVSGLVFGDINVDGEVIIGETGYVKGNVYSTFAVVAGIVEGDLHLSSYASLKSTGSVTGDITCTAISIEDGAIFTGACHMIGKSNAISKKLKKINEQATAALEEQSKALKVDQPVEEDAADTEMDVFEPDFTPEVEYAAEDEDESIDDEESVDESEPAWFSLDEELANEEDEPDNGEDAEDAE